MVTSYRNDSNQATKNPNRYNFSVRAEALHLHCYDLTKHAEMYVGLSVFMYCISCFYDWNKNAAKQLTFMFLLFGREGTQ